MSDPGLVALLAAVFGALLALGAPVVVALGLAGFAFFLAGPAPPLVVVQKMSVQMGDSTLAAIPFFILCGQIMTAGGMAHRLVDLANVCVGFLRGGLAMVNVVASMFFGGISGSSVADTSSIGSILIPMMVEKGYDRDFSVAVTVTSSTQGIVIPPSHNAILYSLASGGSASIQALFLAGYLPGLTLGLGLIAVAAWTARARDYPRGERVSPRRAARIVVGALPALATPFIIIVPIALGRVPAHQAGVVAVLWAALASTAIHRSLPLAAWPGVLGQAVRTSGMVLLLLGAAAAVGEALTLLHVPAALAAAVTAATDSRVGLLLLVNLLLLGLGTLMDMAPLIVVTTPILLPVAVELGLDPVQFGILMLLNLGVGLLTPPVGSTLFVGCSLGGITMGRAARAMGLFYAVMLAVLLLVTFVPAFTLWVPARFAG